MEVDGRPVAAGTPAHRLVRQGVVQIPEGRQLFMELTVAENLRLGAYAVGWSREARRTLDEVLDWFPVLRERARQPAGALSGGEQQMLAIGRALMARPRLLLIDEPSLGLAPRVVEDVFARIRAIGRQGVPILLVEQNAAMALDVAVAGLRPGDRPHRARGAQRRAPRRPRGPARLPRRRAGERGDVNLKRSARSSRSRAACGQASRGRPGARRADPVPGR